MEITRSFSQKVQVRQYEPADFFCSVKTECEEKDKVAVSRKLDAFVQGEVLKSVADFQNKKAKKIEAKEEALNDIAEGDWAEVPSEEKQVIIKQL